MNSEGVLIAVITGVATFLATKTKSRLELEQKHVDSNAGTTEVYVQHMEHILTGYREQVDDLREQVKGLQKDFDDFKAKHKTEIGELKDYTSFLEEEKQYLLDEINDLKTENNQLTGLKERLLTENAALKSENERLKGGTLNGN